MEIDARAAIQKLQLAALHHRRSAKMPLTPEQQAQLEEHRVKLAQEARARGERVP